MKVRISYLVEVDDMYRLAIRHHSGRKGKANRDEVKQWFQYHGQSMDDDVVAEYEQYMRESYGCKEQ